MTLTESQYINLYHAIDKSMPRSRERHGSNRKYSCNDPACKFNGGPELHNLTIKEKENYIFNRIKEITKTKG